MQQMEQAKLRKNTEAKLKKEIPDIEGNCGYPPIKEATRDEQRALIIKSYQNTKEVLLKQVIWFCSLQMQEKKEKTDEVRKAEKTSGLWYTQNRDLRIEEEKEKLAQKEKKLLSQQAWKEALDMETEIKRLKASCVRGSQRGFFPGSPRTLKLPSPLQGHSTMRASREGLLVKTKSQPDLHSNFFITNEPETIPNIASVVTPRSEYKGNSVVEKNSLWHNKQGRSNEYKFITEGKK